MVARVMLWFRWCKFGLGGKHEGEIRENQQTGILGAQWKSLGAAKKQISHQIQPKKKEANPLIDPMPTISFINTKPILLRRRLNQFAQIPKQISRFGHPNRLVQALPRRSDQGQVRFGDFGANGVRRVEVAVVAVVVECYVEVDDVAVFEGSRVGDSWG